jgi:hypothetical protein
MTTINAVQIYVPEDCRHGLCDCASAKECKFPRCDNCDEILDANGKWIDDNQYHGEEPLHCPDCGAPLK